MASGWSNAPWPHSQWTPVNPPPPPRYIVPPPRHGLSNARAPAAYFGGHYPPPILDLSSPQRAHGGLGLLPHPPSVTVGASLVPFACPRQQIGPEQAIHSPRGAGAAIIRPFHALRVGALSTQQPIRLMNPGTATNTSTVNNSASRPSNQRRPGRSSHGSSNSNSNSHSERSTASIYPRPPTPVSLSLAYSPPLTRRHVHIRDWSPPSSLYDEDDFDLAYDYRLEFEPYDLSDDSEDDMYYLTPRSMRRSPPARLKGGYECQFVKPLSSEVQSECSICLSVLREPFLVDCCGYHFCKSCIETVKDDHKPCPLCNNDFKTMPNKQLQRLLNQREVYCKHKEEGCEWTGELSKLDEHLNVDCDNSEKRLSGCEYTEIKCSHCKKMVQRKDFKLHNIRCSGEKYTCEYCNKYSASYHKVTEEHWPECSAYPVKCPNGCEESLKRSDLNKHLACDCPQTVVQCDLAHFGCEVQLPRVEMASHIENGAMDHISLLTTKFHEAQDEIDGLKEEYADMAFEVHCLQEMNTSIREDNDVLLEELEEKDHELEEKEKEIEMLRKKLADTTVSPRSTDSPEPPPTSPTPQTPLPTDNKALMIGNLPPSVNEQKLKSLFGPFGRVTRVNFLKNSDALLVFERPESVRCAMAKGKTGGLRLHGQKLSLRDASNRSIPGGGKVYS